MEDDFKYLYRLEMTSTIFVNGRQTLIFLKMEDKIKYNKEDEDFKLFNK